MNEFLPSFLPSCNHFVLSLPLCLPPTSQQKASIQGGPQTRCERLDATRQFMNLIMKSTNHPTLFSRATSLDLRQSKWTVEIHYPLVGLPRIYTALTVPSATRSPPSATLHLFAIERASDYGAMGLQVGSPSSSSFWLLVFDIFCSRSISL